MEDKPNYSDALNKYFELKSTYAELSKKKKKLTCIQCKKAGGTVFSNQKDRYTAVCGADIHCGLHIELYRGSFRHITNLLNTLRDALEQTKEDIIHMDNKETFHLFRMSEDKKKLFEDAKAHNETARELFQNMGKLYDCIYNNDEVADQIAIKIKQINEMIVDIRTDVHNYLKEYQIDFLKTAVEKQRTALIPSLAELRNLKYEVSEVDETDKKIMVFENGRFTEIKIPQWKLVELQVHPEKELINLKENPFVVHWNFR
jgi:transcription elongation factor Elf1